jgi:hypothetical protein
MTNGFHGGRFEIQKDSKFKMFHFRDDNNEVIDIIDIKKFLAILRKMQGRTPVK